jgi:hypothetical protein
MITAEYAETYEHAEDIKDSTAKTNPCLNEYQ